MDVHVDPLGGWAGDMFVAACLDACPAFWGDVEAAVAALKLGAEAACRLVPHQDGVLTGHRFAVAAESSPRPDATHAHPHDHDHPHPHTHDHPHPHTHDHRPAPGAAAQGGHRRWADIRALIGAAAIEPAIAAHAVGIFALLAEAEAAVHGHAIEDVVFHEVGAVDSMVDIVAAAVLIARLAPGGWTASPLPLGGGRVRTAHGVLPVPAPATALLLRGLPTLDDGIAGERVTPTGAAVARYLLRGGTPDAPRRPRRLVATGTGFGTRTLPGLSNCLRVLVFEPAEPEPHPEVAPAFAHRQLGVVTFEVDDQSAEDLSHGLDHIRAAAGVHDVVQSVVFGKKGRMATHVQVLVAPEHLEAAIAACFLETTTIGLRYHRVDGAALPRRFADVDVAGRALRVKVVTRPDGSLTGKAEAGDVAADPGLGTRVALRRAAEAAALAPQRTDDA